MWSVRLLSTGPVVQQYRFHQPAVCCAQATVGLLVAKTLTNATANPFLSGGSGAYNPVLALDVFLVQASFLSLQLSVLSRHVSHSWVFLVMPTLPGGLCHSRPGRCRPVWLGLLGGAYPGGGSL